MSTFFKGGQNFPGAQKHSFWLKKTSKKILFFSKKSKNILFLAGQGGRQWPFLPSSPLWTPMSVSLKIKALHEWHYIFKEGRNNGRKKIPIFHDLLFFANILFCLQESVSTTVAQTCAEYSKKRFWRQCYKGSLVLKILYWSKSPKVHYCGNNNCKTKAEFNQV